MTKKQYKRFCDLIEGIDIICENRKSQFIEEYMQVVLKDKKNITIKFKLKTYKGYDNKQYIRDVFISALKNLENEKKQLYLDDTCELTLKFVKMPKIYKKKRQKRRKEYKK